jgi:hypothetical protein
MAEIQISDDAVREIAQAALLQTLTAEARENVITQAITWMTTPPKDPNSYGNQPRRPTPLEDAFQIAMRAATMKLVSEMIEEEGPVREFVHNELRKLIEEFSKQLDGDSYGQLRSVLIEAMVEHLATERAERYR